jgi:hypothetical protein
MDQERADYADPQPPPGRVGELLAAALALTVIALAYLAPLLVGDDGDAP